jgi:hypothetical protein
MNDRKLLARSPTLRVLRPISHLLGPASESLWGHAGILHTLAWHKIRVKCLQNSLSRDLRSGDKQKVHRANHYIFKFNSCLQVDGPGSHCKKTLSLVQVL